ncbi:hypothetical protein TNCV_4112791 [Trichonephila clavipes]|nr:hypothetical protein TNCV_4112791 [Trichonephila clavipes]
MEIDLIWIIEGLIVEDISMEIGGDRVPSENFSRGARRQGGRLNILKVQDHQDNQSQSVEDKKVDERNLSIDISETKLNVVANVSDKNPVGSIIGEKVTCAIIRDLELSSREQLIEEQRKDPELGHIYRYLENQEDSSVNATMCEN